MLPFQLLASPIILTYFFLVLSPVLYYAFICALYYPNLSPAPACQPLLPPPLTCPPSGKVRKFLLNFLL